MTRAEQRAGQIARKPKKGENHGPITSTVPTTWNVLPPLPFSRDPQGSRCARTCALAIKSTPAEPRICITRRHIRPIIDVSTSLRGFARHSRGNNHHLLPLYISSHISNSFSKLIKKKKSIYLIVRSSSSSSSSKLLSRIFVAIFNHRYFNLPPEKFSKRNARLRACVRARSLARIGKNSGVSTRSVGTIEERRRGVEEVARGDSRKEKKRGVKRKGGGRE